MAKNSQKKFILAISGGVDSIVLLEIAARIFGKNNIQNSRAEFNFSEIFLADFRENFCGKNAKKAAPIFPKDFLVAHFEHGIRGENSKKDAQFVENLAQKYGVDFVKKSGNLGAKTSEEMARKKRYEFLFSLANNADQKIVTAHHADDFLETILINLLRNDGWRGLAPMRANAKILRPMIHANKAEIVRFAIENELIWREDETNAEMKFFRNRVREFLAGRNQNFADKILKMSEKQQKLRDEIEAEVQEIFAKISGKNAKNLAKNQREYEQKFSRYFFIMIDEKSALEILRAIFAAQLTRPELRQIWIFLRTGRAGRKMRVANFEIYLEKREFWLKKLSESARFGKM